MLSDNWYFFVSGTPDRTWNGFDIDAIEKRLVLKDSFLTNQDSSPLASKPIMPVCVVKSLYQLSFVKIVFCPDLRKHQIKIRTFHKEQSVHVLVHYCRHILVVIICEDI